MSTVCFQSAVALSRSLRDREFSVVELVDAFLARIEMLNARTRCYISVTSEAARHAAAECDKKLAQGDAGSIFFGIPFGVKDLIDIKGVATTGGSAVLHDNVATANAAVIDRLNAVGAVSLGKTNLHEFAYGTSGENTVYGTAVNAYDHERLACGSSSGSAAAVAHGLAAFALGTDTGGSVRVPAVMNGLVGLKPTFGSLSTEGVLPFCWSFDHVGLITRTVEDCASLFTVCADAGDATALAPLDRGTPRGRSIAGLRVGIPESGYLERTDPEILAVTEEAGRWLERSGAIVSQVTLPDTRFARTVSLTIQMPEALSFHSRYLESRGSLYGSDLKAGLALGQYILAEHYVRAKRLLTQYRAGMRAIFANVDAILTPATPIAAPKIGTVTVTMDGVEEAIGNALTRFTSFFNMTGHPAITLPTTLNSLGLPIGVQLIGRYHEETLVLRVAALLEERAGRLPLPDATTGKTSNHPQAPMSQAPSA